jgi:hypothetical protein
MVKVSADYYKEMLFKIQVAQEKNAIEIRKKERIVY